MRVKFIHYTWVLVFFGTILSKAQVFGTQYRQQFTYVTALSYPADGNSRVLATAANPGLWLFSKIYVYNSSLALIDSIPLLKGTVPQRNEPIKINNRLYWPVIYYDTLNNLGGKFSVLELDTFYRHVALHKLNNYDPIAFLTNVNIAHISNRFYVSYISELSTSTSVIYKLDNQFLKLDSVRYSGALTDMNCFGNFLMISGATSTLCPGQYAATMKMTILDTNFTVQNCYSFDSLGAYVPPPNYIAQRVGIKPISSSSKTIPISKTKVFAAGSSPFRYQIMVPVMDGIVNAILSNNNQVISLSVFGNSVTNTNYFENSNFAAVKKNQIITVGCIGNDFQYFGIVQPQKTKIFVNKLDTMGNVIWVKELGGDMFYRPASIVFTPDDGCLIAGFRYDSTTMKSTDSFNQLVYESFLLRLDANGEILDVGIIENGKINPYPIKCFPNPSGDKIYFDFLFRDSVELIVYSTLGSEALKMKDYPNLSALDISALDKGIYFYKVLTKTKSYSGKFIKE